MPAEQCRASIAKIKAEAAGAGVNLEAALAAQLAADAAPVPDVTHEVRHWCCSRCVDGVILR